MEKLIEMSRKLDSQLQRDYDYFEKKFSKQESSLRHKYIFKSIRRRAQLPTEVYLEYTNTNTDEEKTDLFNTLFQLIFKKSDCQMTIEERKVVRIDKNHFSRKETKTALKALNIAKAKRPDGIT